MSSSSHEDVFDSDSDTEKPLTGQGSSKEDPQGQMSCEMESKGSKTSSPEHWWPGVSKALKCFALSRHTSEEDLIQLSPVKEKQTVQITTKEHSRDQLDTEQHGVVGQDSISGGDRNSALQTPASGLPNGSVANNISIGNDTKREDGNVGGHSSCPSATTQQTVKRVQSGTKGISGKREGSGSRNSRKDSTGSKANIEQGNIMKEEDLFTDSHKESETSTNQTQIPDNSDQVNMSFQPQHADDSSFGTSPTSESRNVQNKGAKQYKETPLSNTELIASAHQPSSTSASNTEDLLIKVTSNLS